MPNAMKNIIFVSIFMVVLACSSGGSSSQESAEEFSPFGTFARGADSLWTQQFETSFEQQVNFQFYASNDKVSYNLSDYADFSEGTDDEDIYIFKDTAELTYSDLILTFSYETGNWEVEDRAFKEGIETDMDLSGEWVRVPE